MSDSAQPDAPLAFSVVERDGIARQAEPIRIGLPLPRGCRTTPPTGLDGDDGRRVAIQSRALAHWPDGSIKWLLIDARIDLEARGRLRLVLGDDAQATGLSLSPDGAALDVATGAARMRINDPAAAVTIDGAIRCDSLLRLRDAAGELRSGKIARLAIEERGPLRAIVRLDGEPIEVDGKALAWSTRLHLFAGKSWIRVETTVHHPGAAAHPGGCWDLQDGGSAWLIGADVVWSAVEPAGGWKLSTDGGAGWSEGTARAVLWQDGSGGERWDHGNHVDGRGELQRRFRGYKLDADGDVARDGLRASPIAQGGPLRLAVGRFWQECPKRLSLGASDISYEFFPEVQGRRYELLGGERKQHVYHVGPADADLRCVHTPLAVEPDARAVRDAGVLPWIPEDPGEVAPLLDAAVEGPHSLFAKRELTDEYGWRHFGELYADHEADFEPGIASHYNNQYDPLGGMLRQYLTRGDARWFTLADDQARHLRDIDVYHTRADRDEWNGGLFWHTDHYLDAATVGHRGFSRRHVELKGAGGGGPSRGHCYTTGLLYHHYVTGDAASRETLLELVDWVARVNEGPRTLLGALDAARRVGLSGLAARRWALPFTRAIGNSIQTLLDGWLLTGERRYLELAERLIRRVATPDDDLDERELDDIEGTWSHTVVLRSIGRYLDLKAERDELDADFRHARDTLLHYARRIRDRDGLYLDRRERLEFPNETWPAQDLRKAAILLHASCFAEAEAFREAARKLYEGALEQLESFGDKRHRTRALALVLQNYEICRWFRENPEGTSHPASSGALPSARGKVPGWRLLLGPLFRALPRTSPGAEKRWLRSRLANGRPTLPGDRLGALGDPADLVRLLRPDLAALDAELWIAWQGGLQERLPWARLYGRDGDVRGAAEHPGCVAVDLPAGDPDPRIEAGLTALAESGAEAVVCLARDAAQFAWIRERAEALGFTIESSWGVDPDYYRAALPLDADHRKRVERFVLGLKRGSRLKARIKRALVAVGESERLYERFLVFLRPNSATKRGVDLEQFLAAELRNEGVIEHESLALVPFSSCLERHGNELVLIFVDGSREPKLVYKQSRHAEFGFKITNEAQALELAGGDAALAPLVPALHLRGEASGRPWFVQEGLAGDSLWKKLLSGEQRRLPGWLAAGLDVLGRIGELAADPEMQWRPERNALSLDADALTQHLDPDTPTIEALARAQNSFAERKRRYFIHGDYWPANLFVDPSGRVTGVIDWEFAIPDRPAPVDAAWYLVNAAYGLAMRAPGRTTIEESFERAFLEGTAGFSPMWHAARRLATTEDLDAPALRDLLVLTLAQLALRERLAYGREGAMDRTCRTLLDRLVAERVRFEEIAAAELAATGGSR